jgi:hypothetical protein
MAQFPTLTTGAVTQYPSGRSSTYSTHVTRFMDGSEQRFRELKAPVRRWLIRLDQISAQEATAIELCYLASQGEFGSFSFVDPWDGTEYPDCSFEQERLSVTAIADSEVRTHLVIRNNSL